MSYRKILNLLNIMERVNGRYILFDKRYKSSLFMDIYCPGSAVVSHLMFSKQMLQFSSVNTKSNWYTVLRTGWINILCFARTDHTAKFTFPSHATLTLFHEVRRETLCPPPWVNFLKCASQSTSMTVQCFIESFCTIWRAISYDSESERKFCGPLNLVC